MNSGRVIYTSDGPMSEPVPEEIELESSLQLESWLNEYAKPENIVKGIKLEHIPYNCVDISSELARRDFIEEVQFSWIDLPQYNLAERK